MIVTQTTNTRTKNMPDSIENLNIGDAVVKLLYLKLEKNNVVDTSIGTKSPYGLSITIQR